MIDSMTMAKADITVLLQVLAFDGFPSSISVV